MNIWKNFQLRISRVNRSNSRQWIADKLLDPFKLLIEEIGKLINSVFTIQEPAYWFIFAIAIIALALGVALPDEKHNDIASVFIGIGTGTLAAYMAYFLQKSTTSIPRKEWTQRISACNNDLISCLLDANSKPIRFYRKRFYSRTFKAHIRQELPKTLVNIRRLEILLHKRKLDVCSNLQINQSKTIKDHLIDINQNIEQVNRDYGRPITNREFNRDLANLKSKLQQAVKTLDFSAKRTLNQIEIVAGRPKFFGNPTINDSNSRKLKTTIYMHSTRLDQAKTNPAVFWSAINLMEYLQCLIDFTNAYGYQNNSTISILDSRCSYIRDRIDSLFR